MKHNTLLDLAITLYFHFPIHGKIQIERVRLMIFPVFAKYNSNSNS